MVIFGQMLALQAQLFILIGLGLLMNKLGIITVQGRQVLSKLLIDLILPCNIISAFMNGTGMTADTAENFAIAILIGAVIQLAAIWGSKAVFRRFPKEKSSVMSYGLICSNSSFIGLPVTEALYGSVGVMYGSVFQIPIRFTMWTSGLALFTDIDRKAALKKLAVHPCILAIFIGIALMVLPIRLPSSVSGVVSGLSGCTMPVSMLVIGAILADADIRSMFSWPVTFFVSLRLVVFPLAVYGVLKLLPVEPMLANISVLMTGMPAGSTTSILADQYGRDSLFASQIVFASTLCSVFTLPILCLLL